MNYMFLIFVIVRIRAVLNPSEAVLISDQPFEAATNLLGYAVLLTNKLVSVSSDGQKQFDLV